jgi:hypothetical protein
MTLPVVFTLVFLLIVALFVFRDVRQGAQFVNQREQLTLWLRLQQEPNMQKNVKLLWEQQEPQSKKQPGYLQWTSCDVLAVPEGLFLITNWQYQSAEVVYLFRNAEDADKYPGVLWKLQYKTDHRETDGRVVFVFEDAGETNAKRVTLSVE